MSQAVHTEHYKNAVESLPYVKNSQWEFQGISWDIPQNTAIL